MPSGCAILPRITIQFHDSESLTTVRPGGRAERDRYMKHILAVLTVALFGVSAPVFAAFNYEVVSEHYYNLFNEGTDYEFYKIKVTEGTGKIYMTDFLNNINDSNQTDSIYQQGITRIGYYDVKGKDPTYTPSSSDYHMTDVNTTDRIVVDSYQVNQWNNPATRYGYELGTFSAGDEVAIYVEQGEYGVGSYTGIQGRNTSRYDAYSVDALAQYRNNWDWNAAKKAMPIAELTLYHSDGGSTQLRFGLMGAEFSGGETFGSPLPGGNAIYVIAGLFALGFFLRRKQAAAA